MILTSVLLPSFLSLLGGTACAAPQELAPERAPYVAFLDGMKEAEADALRTALAGVPGVARVELDAENGRVALHAKDDSYVARVHVEKLLGSRGIELSVFDEPKWSKIMVYVVTTTGGG